jgi:hypothetical protein
MPVGLCAQPASDQQRRNDVISATALQATINYVHVRS